MAVFRVERTTDYTTMSNHHLKNKSLSLKAKGLLSQMLSLPEDWDYTLAGLATINKESVDAIRTAVQELEKAGYITRRQTRDGAGKLAGNEYTIYERPQDVTDSPPDADTNSDPLLENPTTDAPLLENPIPDNPLPDKPLSENPTQLNKDILNTKISKKKSKKEKVQRQPLDDAQLKDHWVQWITRIAGDKWGRGVKNSLYYSLMAFYEPRETRKQDPSRMQVACTRLGNLLVEYSGGDPSVMAQLLDRATASGWKSVFPDKRLSFNQAKPPDTSPGGDYVEF